MRLDIPASVLAETAEKRNLSSRGDNSSTRRVDTSKLSVAKLQYMINLCAKFQYN